jgi:hypothetical protein
MVSKEVALKYLGNLFLRGGDSEIAEQYAKSWASAADLRAKYPNQTRDQLCAIASNKFLIRVGSTGAVSGAIAAAPYFGTISTATTTAGDLFLFGKLSVNHVLLLAALHDLPLDEPQLRRLTVLSSLVGEATHLDYAGESKNFIETFNKKLAERVAIKIGAKLLPARVGAALPLFVGAATGASLNARLANQISSNARGIIRLQAV